MEPIIDAELPIARPPDAVWAALTNWEAAGEWFADGIDRVEPPADGTHNLGLVSFHFGGRVEECSIQDCEPGEGLKLVWAERGVLVSRNYTLRRSEHGNTIVRLVVKVASEGLGLLFRRGVAKRVAARDREQLDRLAAFVVRASREP